MSKIKLNLLFQILASVNLNVIKNDFCYCEKIVSEFCFFSEFSLFWCNKVIFVLMIGTQYYFCSMFFVENWIVVRVKLTMRFLWRCSFAIWLCSQDVIVGMYMVFLYILVFAFCMFKTVKVSVTAESNWGDVNLLSRVGFWLMLRKMCLFVTSIPKTWSG